MIRLTRFLLACTNLVILFWGCAGAPEPTLEPIALAPEPEPEPVITPRPPEPEIVAVPPSPPDPINIKSVTYDLSQMTIEWEESSDTDFKVYELLKYNNNQKVDTLGKFFDIKNTSFSLETFDPTIENWFWIKIKNNSGLGTEGEKMTHFLESEAPKISKLYKLEGQDDLRISWTENHDKDFFKYTIYRSKTNDMVNKEPIKEIFSSEDTLEVLSIDSLYFYQIGVQDYWNLESYSNVMRGDYYVEIWGERFSLVETKKLDFSSQNLFGEIPKEIGKLINLEILLIQNNYLSGEIPDELWNLNKLKVFNMSNNQFNSKIPEDIYKLYSIEELWMSHNSFIGEIPYQLFNLPNLTSLNLSNNKISGSLSEAIERLSNIVYLNLYNNRITGFIPPEIGNLKKIEFLSLGENWIVGEIPVEIANATNLESLALFNNKLIGEIPDGITSCRNLKYLSLFGNQLIGEIPVQLFSELNLSYLRLNNNMLDKIDYDSICESGYNWEKSMYFDLSNNQFDNELPVCFSEPVFFELYSSYNKK